MLTKKVNFFFGKNGTGKTTITETIQQQYENSYQVYVFTDFESLVKENRRLDAIALWTKNTQIQWEIDKIDIEIENIKKQIEQPIDSSKNIFTEYQQVFGKYYAQECKKEKFYEDSARKIKNKTNPQIATTSYNKNALKWEKQFAKLLSDDEIKKYKEILKSEKKDDVEKITFPVISLSDYRDATNILLQRKVSQQQIIDELQNNPEKQSFAREGMQIHEHKIGEKCAFCGQEISEDRWIELSNYFNNEVKKLEWDLENEIKQIDDELHLFKKLEWLNANSFYSHFESQVKILDLLIQRKKSEYENYLKELRLVLEEKKKNLFKESGTIDIVIPSDFEDIKIEYENIVDENNDFSKNLKAKQNSVKHELRYHEIQKVLNDFKYDENLAKLWLLKTSKDEVLEKLNNKKEELAIKQEEKKELISQTKDEEVIAIKISELLKSIWVNSFSLKLVTDDIEWQKWQYQIQRYYHSEGEYDSIMNLSKGEKNIIALLYFILSLGKNSENTKPKIIVFDDPMTSNDDTMQYLMISEIQRFYRDFDDWNFFVLLTHNCHFYLNIRPNTSFNYKVNWEEVSFYHKYWNYRMFNDWKLTSIECIQKGKQDFKTSYELLWKEIIFLYYENNASSDIMLNPFRKICETYMKFNSISFDKFFENYMAVKKLCDVNQHSIDDLVAEMNWKSKEEIKWMLKNIFIQNNAKEHFDSYWSNN